MIRVRFIYHDKQLAGYEMKGHADSGEYGHDIVCAAASVLAINTVNSLEKLAGVKPQVQANAEEGGDLKVELDRSMRDNSNASLILETFKLGIESVASEYAKYIKIEH